MENWPTPEEKSDEQPEKVTGLVTTDLHFDTGLLRQQRLTTDTISVYYTHLQSFKDQYIPVMHLNESNAIEMHFTLKGNGFLKDDNSGATYHYQANQNNMHYLPEFSGTGFHKANTLSTFFEIKINHSFFTSLCVDSNPVLQDFVLEMQKGNVARQNVPITAAMQACIQTIINNPFTGNLKLFYTQSKCIELLAFQTEAYERSLSSNNKRRVNEEDGIRFAAKILTENKQIPPSLQELAKKTGINTFKLKNGFRRLFGCTVFEYLHQERLREAAHQLRTGMPIKEIAYLQGYCSVQHFTRCFKKQFGVTPGNFK